MGISGGDMTRKGLLTKTHDDTGLQNPPGKKF